VHCSAAQTEFIATVTRTHIGQHVVRLRTMQNVNNYLKDDYLMPPEWLRIHSQLVIGRCHTVQHTHLQHELQFQGSNQMPACFICTLLTQHLQRLKILGIYVCKWTHLQTRLHCRAVTSVYTSVPTIRVI